MYLVKYLNVWNFNRRKGTVESSENDDSHEPDNIAKHGHGARPCRIAKTPVHEDAVVHLSAVEPGLCLSCSKDKVRCKYQHTWLLNVGVIN